VICDDDLFNIVFAEYSSIDACVIFAREGSLTEFLPAVTRSHNVRSDFTELLPNQYHLRLLSGFGARKRTRHITDNFLVTNC
jgi:hypothetical protein